ncbi:MAG: hypothetical protein HDT22_05450 [Ruminococcus sp.]|nr:hypothetical protein [Ruminococcus sp.]
MSKLIPYVLMMAILGMLVISWKNVLSYYSSIAQSYQSHIDKAEAYMDKKIYIDAVNEYELALNIKSNDYDTAMKIVDLYDKMENTNGWIKACQNAILADEFQKEPYVKLADYYIENKNFQDAYDILEKAEKKLDDLTEITPKIIKIKGEYKLENLKYDFSTQFCYSDNLKTGYAVVSLDDKKGLNDTSRNVIVSTMYDDIGLLGQDVIPVHQDNEWYYINEDGYRKLVPENPTEYLGTFHNNYAPAKINNIYGYLDKKMQEYHFEYEYAGCFSNGLAAVKRDGKWAVINTSFENITGFDFDEILLDEFGFCCIYNVFFAKQGDKYYLYNTDGKCISDGFDDAKLFVSDEPAAVKKNGKWGFISKSGEIVIDFIYENVDSFNLGYAPYCENGSWGCIDEQGNILIEPIFDTMHAFANNGYALVELDGFYKYVIITIYE